MNEVRFVYNDSGQLVTEWQEHGGPQVTRSNSHIVITIWNPRQVTALRQGAEYYKNATQLHFELSGTTDREFEAVPALPLVEVVSISEERAITDKSLRILATFPRLKTLHLEHTSINGSGFQYFTLAAGQKRSSPPMESKLGSGDPFAAPN